MNERDIALIDHLLSNYSENSLIEFKLNNANPKVIGKLCSALANSARVNNEDNAYVLWGINDATKEIIGTDIDIEAKTVGNEVFQLWLAKRLKPAPACVFRTVDHPDGRVVLLEIPAAIQAPVNYDDISYIRVGSATPKLADFPELHHKLIANLIPFVWEKSVAKAYVTTDEVLKLLDYPAYFHLTNQNLPDNKQGIIEHLSADGLIKEDVGGRWDILNLGAILFANDLTEFDSSLSRKSVRFVAYDGDNRAATVTHRQDGQKGYATGFAGLLGYINGLLPINEHIGEAFRTSTPLFPVRAIRELVANAIIHQDMTISGAGPQIELFSDRLEITNPGKPLVETERMIDLPPRSRNEALAGLMRRMNICEEQGTGLDKVIVDVELFQLPPPQFEANPHSMIVTLYAPRSFANMSKDERIRACFQHAVILYLSGGKKMKNASLCKRLGIESKNASQATRVINASVKSGKIKIGDPEHPKAGYLPWFA